jgi:excisionase family DNA binding protein
VIFPSSFIRYSPYVVILAYIGKDMVIDYNNMGGMLTVSEVSEMLHVHPNTVRRWSDQGVLKAYRIGPRGDRRYRAKDVSMLLTGEEQDIRVGDTK